MHLTQMLLSKYTSSYAKFMALTRFYHLRVWKFYHKQYASKMLRKLFFFESILKLNSQISDIFFNQNDPAIVSQRVYKKRFTWSRSHFRQIYISWILVWVCSTKVLMPFIYTLQHISTIFKQIVQTKGVFVEKIQFSSTKINFFFRRYLWSPSSPYHHVLSTLDTARKILHIFLHCTICKSSLQTHSSQTYAWWNLCRESFPAKFRRQNTKTKHNGNRCQTNKKKRNTKKKKTLCKHETLLFSIMTVLITENPTLSLVCPSRPLDFIPKLSTIEHLELFLNS